MMIIWHSSTVGGGGGGRQPKSMMVMLMVIQKQVQLAAQKMVDNGDNYDDYKAAGMTTQNK